ncbi:uncharacterized protein C5orf52 homolog [Tenrec ecaudatus]|uniref:uncharacterized protein C5orf52 homolog n=1 Tax=Tenrec ecaudatus TaxID=94439 RepID=UPI003F5A2DE1
MPLPGEHPLCPIPEVQQNEGNAQKQSFRPSVTWNLNSPSTHRTSTQSVPNTSSGSTAGFLRRESDHGPEVFTESQPQICFLRPRSSAPPVLFSIMNSSEAAVTKFLPKSHLSRVIIRDNLSTQRIFEMETKASDRTKKKMSHLYDHLKKKFMTDQLRKLGRWRRESLSLQQYLDSMRTYKI